MVRRRVKCEVVIVIGTIGRSKVSPVLHQCVHKVLQPDVGPPHPLSLWDSQDVMVGNMICLSVLTLWSVHGDRHSLTSGILIPVC